MKTSDFEVYEDCGLYRLVCCDYDRDDYLPSVFINETGAHILKSLKAGQTVEEIARFLSQEGPSYEEAFSDVQEFLGMLAQKGYRIEKK